MFFGIIYRSQKMKHGKGDYPDSQKGWPTGWDGTPFVPARLYGDTRTTALSAPHLFRCLM